MTNVERIVDGIIHNEDAGMVCRIALKDETVAKAVSASIERYMHARTMAENAVARTIKWLSEYLSFVSEKAPESLGKPNPWAWYTVVCYASMFAHDKDWRELTEIGLPRLRQFSSDRGRHSRNRNRNSETMQGGLRSQC